MVHGVFFRDFKFPPYWGRIPAELEKNGAKIFYGKHQSAASVADSAEELKQRIEEICNETDCEKVNVIAHSKGGLDIRETLRLCPERIASVWAEQKRTFIARRRLFSVLFPFFTLSGDSPTASQKEKIPRKFHCGRCLQFSRYGFLA